MSGAEIHSWSRDRSILEQEMVESGDYHVDSLFYIVYHVYTGDRLLEAEIYANFLERRSVGGGAEIGKRWSRDR